LARSLIWSKSLRAALMDPAEQLDGAKTLLAQTLAVRGKRLEIEVEKIGRRVRHG
jgi:hypothetical protein